MRRTTFGASPTRTILWPPNWRQLSPAGRPPRQSCVRDVVDPLATNLPAVSWAMMSARGRPGKRPVSTAWRPWPVRWLAFASPRRASRSCGRRRRPRTEWATLIGPKEHRVWVGTDIPVPEIPGQNHNDMVVWRDAGTGRSSPLRVAPGDDGGQRGAARLRRQHVPPGQFGTLIKLTPVPERNGQWEGSK